MLRLLKFFKPYAVPFLGLIVLVYAQVTANLALPDYMANIINHGIVGQDLNYIYRTGLTMLLVALAGGVCTVGVGFLGARIATGFATRLRDGLFEHIESFSLLEFNDFSTASLITRTTNDIQQLQMVLVILLRMALMAPFMGIGAILKAYGLAPQMTWIMAIAIGALLCIIVVLFLTAIPRFKRLQQMVDQLNLVTREILTGLRVIRAFNKEQAEEAKFAATNEDLTHLNLVVNRLTALMQPMMMLILGLTSIAIVWVGSHQIDLGTLQIGDMLAFMQYASQSIFAFLMISIIFIMVPRAAVSAERVAQVLARQTSIKDPATPSTAPHLGGVVEFKDVTYAYEGAEEPVLHNITFVAQPGQTTAIVGSTGSGKSTLLNLIPRFYEVTKGAVLVDGVDVRQMKQADLRSRIGYVSQKAVLFSGTVTSNIAYANPRLRADEIKKMAAIAQAEEFISQLEHTYHAPIAQGGTNVSGGQKQRLSIARALAAKPELLLFDDSFSALDFQTDAKLRQALEKQTNNQTVIIVAQRISTIMHADKIVVLDRGRIVGQGTHQQLLKVCSVYREIAASQLTAAELGAEKKRSVSTPLARALQLTPEAGS